jgi:hypothetical protein
MNSAPFEIIAAPFTLYVAAVATAFPDVDEAPGASWTKVGTSGADNYSEDGVTVQMAQTLETFRALGSTGARKAFRTEEELRISMTLMDLTLEQVKYALNENAITTTAAGSGTPGTKKIGLSRGTEVTRCALLVRGVSPYGDMAAQFEVPIAVVDGEPELVLVKGEPVGVALEFMALEDVSASSVEERFGRFVAQTAAAL